MAQEGSGITFTFRSSLLSGQVFGVALSGRARAKLDTTVMDNITTDNGEMTCIPSKLKNPGDIQLRVKFNVNTKMADIETAMSADPETFTMQFRTPTGMSTGPSFSNSAAFMTDYALDSPHDGIITGTIGIALSGQVTWTPAS